MIDNTDINTLIVDAILVDNENQAEFILKKLNEDVVVTDTMKEALGLYEKMLKEKKTMNEYKVIQYTQGTLTYTVKANSEDEALALVERGEVEYDYHEWDENGEPFVDE